MDFATDTARIPPHSEAAELSVLGTVMLYASDALPLVGHLAVDDFFFPHHREAWAAILAVSERRRPVDVISVGDEVKTAGMEARFRDGWQAWAVKAAASVTVWHNVGVHADVVRKTATLRKLISLAVEIQGSAYGNQPADDVLARAREGVAALEVSGGGKGPEKIETLLSGALEAIEARTRGEAVIGVPTSLPSLGRIISAYKPGRMYVLGGRPGDGKTALAGQEVLHAAMQGFPAIFFSREMINAELVERDLALVSRVPAYSIGSGALQYTDWKKIQNAAGEIAKANLWLDDRSVTIEKIIAETRKWHALNVRNRPDRLGIMALDYLQLARLAKARSQSNREQVVAEMSRALKEAAQEMQIPVLVLSQLNREAEKRGGRPIPSDLRESGAIEQDADIILFVYRDIDPTDQAARRLPGPAEVICGKHRGGPTGIANVHFETTLMQFTGAADEAPQAPDARPNWQDKDDE